MFKVMMKKCSAYNNQETEEKEEDKIELFRIFFQETCFPKVHLASYFLPTNDAILL